MSLLALVSLLIAQSLTEAESALERENYERALQMADQILSAKPKELYAYYIKAQAYLGQARQQEENDPQRTSLLQKASDVSQIALAKNSKYAYAYLIIAEVARLQGQAAEAKAVLAKAEEYGTNDVKVLVEAARIYTLLRDKQSIDRATLLLSKAKTKDPQNPAIYRALGDLWLEQGVTELALDQYRQATTLEPNNPENHFRLGVAYAKLKSIREAGEALRKAIELDPGYAPAYRELGEIYFIAQKYQQAKEYYKKYVMLRPELPARVRYATFLYLSKDYKEAIQEIETVLKDTFSLTLQRLLGYSLVEDQQYEQAVQALDRYFAKQAADKVIAKDYLYYAKALDKAGKDEQAIAYYQKAIQKDKALAAEVYPEVANAYNALGRYKEAAEALQKAIEKNPSLQNHYALGKIYYKLGQTEKDTTYYLKAMEAFGYVAQKKPDLVVVHVDLGRCAAMLDPESQQGRAKPHYEQVIQLASQDPARYKAELIEAYTYLGYYYYVKAESSNFKADYQSAYEAYKRLQELDPQNAQAAQALPYLEQRIK